MWCLPEGDLLGCDPCPAAPAGALGGFWRWPSPLAGWLLAPAALCQGELIPFPIPLAGRNKLSPSLGAPDPLAPPQPYPCSPSPPQPCSIYLHCKLPSLLILRPGMMREFPGVWGAILFPKRPAVTTGTTLLLFRTRARGCGLTKAH